MEFVFISNKLLKISVFDFLLGFIFIVCISLLRHGRYKIYIIEVFL